MVQALQTDHNFGTIVAGPKLEQVFEIRNSGNAELKIAGIRTNCGCTVAKDYPKSIDPGASGLFPFTLNTAGFKGPFSKTITISTNDPANPELKLVLRGSARQPFAIEPLGAFFGSVYGVKPRTRVVTIENNSDQPLKLAIDPISSTGGFNFELSEKVPGRCYELLVTFNLHGLKPGLARATATLLTNWADQRQIQVAATATVRDRLDLEPPTFAIPPKAAKDTALLQRTLRLKNFGERSVKALSASADDPGLEVKIEEETPGREYAVVVSAPAGYAPPAGGRTITIRTDDPEKPILTAMLQPAQAEIASSTRRPRAETRIGQAAPDFNLPTLAGKTISAAQLADEVTVLNFFSPGCGFCKKQLPRVDALRKVYEPLGVRFMHVGELKSKTPYTPEQVKTKLQEWGLPLEAALDDGNSVGQLFGVTGFPTMFVLGKTARVEAVNVGNREDLEERLKAQLDALLAAEGGQPVQPPASAPARASAEKPTTRPAAG